MFVVSPLVIDLKSWYGPNRSLISKRMILMIFIRRLSVKTGHRILGRKPDIHLKKIVYLFANDEIASRYHIHFRITKTCTYITYIHAYSYVTYWNNAQLSFVYNKIYLSIAPSFFLVLWVTHLILLPHVVPSYPLRIHILSLEYGRTIFGSWQGKTSMNLFWRHRCLLVYLLRV